MRISMTLNMLRIHKNTILRVAHHYHAENIRVFGSVVREEAGESSDIDLLVSFLPGASLLDQAGLMSELGDVLGTKVDIISDRAINHHIRDKILKEARSL